MSICSKINPCLLPIPRNKCHWFTDHIHCFLFLLFSCLATLIDCEILHLSKIYQKKCFDYHNASPVTRSFQPVNLLQALPLARPLWYVTIYLISSCLHRVNKFIIFNHQLIPFPFFMQTFCAKDALERSCYLKIDFKIPENVPVYDAVKRMAAHHVRNISPPHISPHTCTYNRIST